MIEEPSRILVADDEPSLRSFLADALRTEGHRVDEAADGDATLAAARRTEYAVIVSDLRMPGRSGLDLVRDLRGLPDPPEVVVLTAYGTVSTAVEAMKAGAFEFLEKPLPGPDLIRLVVRRAAERRHLLRDNERLRGADRGRPRDAVVVDERMKALYERIRRVAATDTTVLILGESGAGKEVVARELHRLRFGEDGPFVAINCAALPENLLESELFGHERGAFTGAVERKLGLFEVASSGTLFLDEVGDLPPGLQGKLLRVLETREFTRLGGVRTLSTNARLVAATNRDLVAAVRAGRFREDLYYRLGVFPVTVPPLRERPDDVPALASRFLVQLGTKLGRPDLSLSAAALDALAAYDWPGNVRELRNVLERAVILADSAEIGPADLGLPALPSRAGDLPDGVLASMERDTILRVLDECSGNRRTTASKLGISLRTLQYRLKEYGLT